MFNPPMSLLGARTSWSLGRMAALAAMALSWGYLSCQPCRVHGPAPSPLPFERAVTDRKSHCKWLPGFEQWPALRMPS